MAANLTQAQIRGSDVNKASEDDIRIIKMANECTEMIRGLAASGFRVSLFDISIAERDIATKLAEAVSEEREACAKLAESKCGEWTAEAHGESMFASQNYFGRADAGREIAAAIRSRNA